MKNVYLFKFSLYFTIGSFFYACNSREERISSIKTEIKLLSDSMAVASKNALEPRLQQKAMLEDTLDTYLAPFNSRLARLNEKVLSTEKEFRKHLKRAKDLHFSRYGHHPASQGSLNETIDNLIFQKEQKVKDYQAEISRIEKSYKNDPYYIETTKRIVALEAEMQKENRKISQRYQGKIKKLEDNLIRSSRN